MRLTPEQISFYEENGFVLLRNFFSQAQVSRLIEVASIPFRRQLSHYSMHNESASCAILDTHISLLKIGRQIHTNTCIAARNALMCCDLLSSTALLDVVSSLTKGVHLAMSTIPVLSFHHPNIASNHLYWAIPAHRDFPSMQGSINGCVAWVPFVDICKDIGPLEVIPGSHALEQVPIGETKIQSSFGLLELDSYKDESFIQLEVNAGDLILFHTFLIHRSGINKSDRNVRMTLQLRYNDLDDPYYISKSYICPYKYTHVDKWL
jgi:phytanoyl-CoA hydroxylase